MIGGALAGAVTGAGIRLRDMRLLVHRGQALLLLVVGGLTGVAVAGAALGRGNLPAPVVTTVSELFAQPRQGLPARIEISTSSPSPATLPQPQPASVATAEPSPTPPPPPPTAVTTVVPGAVYSYPPDDHGGGSGRGRGGHG
jgi:hypothetical protein